ncbi:unnamed protein product [Gongylonema pulchrum]|uniref:Uncharacterized protein n=1 Tax=Gongylonema pulchrum TaxID=637853 RepID=A0A183DJR8_9BILA|nr:unnamed protein product [Gongylonema pulchrum]
MVPHMCTRFSRHRTAVSECRLFAHFAWKRSSGSLIMDISKFRKPLKVYGRRTGRTTVCLFRDLVR